ncbi:hypothetical protein IIB51_03100 [Patescibacteria group bacterium]|nr:hypothetical protein [Patescibacteria group bacterium]MCH8889224.1 hypothetical protein [Patescibacteria group bacterium]
MKRSKNVIVWAGIVVFLMLFGRFVYYNIVVPWPYREQLRLCLEDARSLEIEAEVKEAENICFRTYPHFN